MEYSLLTPPTTGGLDAPSFFEQQRPCVLHDMNEEASKPSHHSERLMGPTEVSYFLPSRENGVNDMYLHLGFSSPSVLTKRSRVSLILAILRLRHPLLASHVEMHGYDDVRFVYTAPESVDAAIENANASLEYKNECGKDLIDGYLNGPRTLLNDRLLHLILAPTGNNGPMLSPPLSPAINAAAQQKSGAVHHDILICAAHFLGDGMALHQFANDFFSLLGSTKGELELHSLLQDEWRVHFNKKSPLPAPLEARLSSGSDSALFKAARRVDFQNLQRKQIGGQTFPKTWGKDCHTIVPTVAINESRTKKILKTCKAKGVSISSALFALCNIAWARASLDKGEMPTLMYSALNLRPNLCAEKALNDSYWYLAIGYFNVILPTFLPKDPSMISKIFWHRSRLAKQQSTAAAKSPMLVSRSHLTAEERGARARGWAKEDDDKARGVWTPPPSPKQSPKATPKTPSTALMGLSLLGNLDGIYKHANFGDIKMHSLTTGSRQRSGGMLLFGYTFAGKLWVSLGYDENGFEETMAKEFWNQVITGIEEFLEE